MCEPLPLAVRLIHQWQTLPRPRQLCLSSLRHSMHRALIYRVGQDPQRLVPTGQTQEQQEAVAPELLTQQQDSGQAKGATHMLRSPFGLKANISARSLL